MREENVTAITDEIGTLMEGVQQRLQKLRAMVMQDTEVQGQAIVCAPDRAEMVGGTVIHVYWLGCAGLATLSAALPGKPPVARIGCSVERDIEVRLCTADRDRYGSWSRDASGAYREEPGFARWVMQAIPTTPGSIDLAVQPKTRTIKVMLPEGMTRRQFDRALHLALAPWSLADRHPDRARYTCYSMGVDRMSRAQEIYVGLDPRHDGDRLLALVEGIIAAPRRQGEQDRPRSPKQSELPVSSPLQMPASPRTRRPMSPAQVNAMRARLQGGGTRKAS